MKFLNALLTLCVGYTVFGEGAAWVFLPSAMIEFEPEYQNQTFDETYDADKPMQVYHYTFISLHWLRGRVYIKWISHVEEQEPIKLDPS